LRIIVDQAYHNLPHSEPKVADYMTRDVKTMSPANNVVEAATEFLNSPIRRMPVVENGVLIGQVSRIDILRAAKSISLTNWG
jgi:signal-transduction protein with cAMP-binding, CBS, and nucleotidyltransferase domain